MEDRDDISVLCLSNDDTILHRNLQASPAIGAGALPLHVARNPVSATIAYNQLIQEAGGGIAILAHHDVYLPNGWRRLLCERISQLEREDPDWAVLAAYGVGFDGRHWGPVWSSALSGILGGISGSPIPIQSADELLIVLRTDSGLRFDENLPHFHFHGLDIVQTARAAGKGAYAMPLPLIHNDRFDKNLAHEYRDCYHYMRRKWRGQLPLLATTTKISWHGAHLYKSMRRMSRYRDVGSDRASQIEMAPQRYADLCGWTTIAPVRS